MDERREILPFSDVRGKANGVAAQAVSEGIKELGAARTENEVGAAFRKQDGRSLADAAAGACDGDGLPLMLDMI